MQKFPRLLTSAVGIPWRKPWYAEEQGWKPDTCRRIRSGFAIGRAEHQRVEPLLSAENLAAIARRPEIHIVPLSAEHDVAVRGTAWRRSTVRPAENDVVALTAEHDVVAVQAEHDVVATAAIENVSAVERLICDCARLNQGVILFVVVESDDDLRALAVFDECRLAG